VYLDIEEGLSLDVLDLVDPWLQFSILEDGREVAGHSWWNKYDNAEHVCATVPISQTDMSVCHTFRVDNDSFDLVRNQLPLLPRMTGVAIESHPRRNGQLRSVGINIVVRFTNCRPLFFFLKSFLSRSIYHMVSAAVYLAHSKSIRNTTFVEYGWPRREIIM